MREYIVDTDDFDSHDALVGYIKYNYKELIRCKDCKHYEQWTNHKICMLLGSYYGNTQTNDYCSNAERRES